jgi:hypothetical protein
MKHERAPRKKQEEHDQSKSINKKDSQPSFDSSHAWEQGKKAINVTPFRPKIEEHAALLGQTHTDEQRASLLLQLQQTYGNSYVQRLLNYRYIKTKLNVSSPGDKQEIEAEEVAKQIINMTTVPSEARGVQRKDEEGDVTPNRPLAESVSLPVQSQIDGEEEEEELQPASTIQRQDEEEETTTEMKELEETDSLSSPFAESVFTSFVQRQSDNDSEIGNNLESRLAANSGGGRPLSADTRAYMEPRFGVDFGSVRVHTDTEATRMSDQLNAQAFTHGRDIYFANDKYAPDSQAGKHLLAHELTHVIQQGMANRSLMNESTEASPTFGWSRQEAGAVQRQDESVELPGYSKIVADGTVKGELDKAWKKTQDRASKDGYYEHGFWIQWNSDTAKYSVTSLIEGPKSLNSPQPQQATLSPGTKPADSGHTYTIGFFHTHPTTEYWAQGWERKVGPSTEDETFHNDASVNVAGVVYDYEGTGGKVASGHPKTSAAKLYHSGPNARPPIG